MAVGARVCARASMLACCFARIPASLHSESCPASYIPFLPAGPPCCPTAAHSRRDAGGRRGVRGGDVGWSGKRSLRCCRGDLPHHRRHAGGGAAGLRHERPPRTCDGTPECARFSNSYLAFPMSIALRPSSMPPGSVCAASAKAPGQYRRVRTYPDALQALVARLEGGGEREVGGGAALLLDASASADPDVDQGLPQVRIDPPLDTSPASPRRRARPQSVLVGLRLFLTGTAP